MPKLDSITLGNPRLINRLDDDISYHKSGIQQRNNLIAGRRDQITRLNQQIAEIRYAECELFHHTDIHPNILQKLQDLLSTHKLNANTDIEFRQREIARAAEARARHQEQLTKAELNRRQLKPPVTITVKHVKEALKDNQYIDYKSIRLLQNTHGTCIAWKFKGLQLTPRSNPYLWINTGKKISFPLPDINAYLYPNRMDPELVCKAVPKNSNAKVRGYDSIRSVHPHIIYKHGGCCLGDFKVNLTEALRNHDIKMAVLLAQMFLETCNPADPAGKHWIKFLLNQLPEKYQPFRFQSTSLSCFSVYDPPSIWTTNNESKGFAYLKITYKNKTINPILLSADEASVHSRRNRRIDTLRRKIAGCKTGESKTRFQLATRPLKIDPCLVSLFHIYNQEVKRIIYMIDNPQMFTPQDTYSAINVFYGKVKIDTIQPFTRFCSPSENPIRNFQNYLYRISGISRSLAALAPKPTPTPPAKPTPLVKDIGYASTVEELLAM